MVSRERPMRMIRQRFVGVVFGDAHEVVEVMSASKAAARRFG
jgi:hypothetical protein